MEHTLKVKVKRLHPDAVLPSYTRHGDAAMDVRCLNEVILNPKDRIVLNTGLAFEIPFGYEMQVRGRSGIAANNGIGLVNGVGTIDSNFRGELKVILINHGYEPFSISKGDRIAQVVFKKIEFTQIEEADELTETSRGEGALGSSGIK